ncbi:MAG TPA: hypothetical protein VNS32_26415, partial [Flavisolibacter sp.]|nr:hypothetical protein [Flavisolibacter sp.]
DLFLADVTAFHPTQGMPRIIQVHRMPVKRLPASRFLPSRNDEQKKELKHKNEAICGAFGFQCGEDNMDGRNREGGDMSV